ncbi:MAG TPA: GAF domain-containing sensor histidine kinase [Pedobacter sp.]|jgi:signal transduction histidine kinase
MHNDINPIPINELERLISLSELDLDLTNLENNFTDLTILAAKIAGTEMSVVNIIDSFTQWSIASHGIGVGQVPREESVCQYTLLSEHPFEVPDFTLDERFNTKDFVTGPLGLRYYYGLPLQIIPGVNIGSLCLVDTQVKTLTPEKIELLVIVAETVIKRLKSYHALQLLQDKLKESDELRKKVAHDIRGPLAGIIGLSELMAEDDIANDPEQLMEYIGMINKSGKSLLDLADEILSESSKLTLSENELNLTEFKNKLDKLYTPQALVKNVILEVVVDSANTEIPFSRSKLLQIAGNLISNAIKFTPKLGKVQVRLSLKMIENQKVLYIEVADNGIGIDAIAVENIISRQSETTKGTMGEKGYGFGLSLVSHLVESLNGKLTVKSEPGKGTSFEVILPQNL